MKTFLHFLRAHISILLVCIGVLLATFPLFHPGLIPTHDGEYHLIRFYEFDKTLREGNAYPRWAPDLNYSYGIPLLTYVYPLPNYVASFMHVLGASFLDSVKLDMIASSLVGAIFFYLWTRRFWGNAGGLVSSIFYTFAPYHFVDIYVRGSVGEVMALGVFPGFLWAYTAFIDSKKPHYFLLSILFLSLTIFSHNILGLMFFIFALCYSAFLILQGTEKIKHITSTIGIFFLTLSLSAIFWIPALLETHYVTGLQVYNVQRNFPDMFQLLFPSWGTGFFDTNLGDQMSVQIGITNLLGVVLAGIAFFVLHKKKRKQANTIVFFLGWFVLLFFFMLKVSLPLWQHIPLVNYFQFPWRFLSLMILVCSFLAGSIVLVKPSKIIVGILLFIAVATTISYTQPAYYMLRNDAYYTSRSNFIDGTNSPGNVFNTIWNTTQQARPTTLFVTEEGVTVAETKKISSTKFSAVVSNIKPLEQVVYVSYFPSWHVIVDGKQVPVFPKNGLLAYTLPEGQHTIHISLLETSTETIAKIITLTTICILFAIFFFRRKISTLL